MIKDVTRKGPGNSIVLCDHQSCGWYEASMPGNIFYAYIGRVAGFTEIELRAGAVFAQQTDPDNNPDTNDWQPSWSPIGLDQATDQTAITLGFQLYNLTRGSSDINSVTAAFKTVLKQYKKGLHHQFPAFTSYSVSYPNTPNGPLYPIGRFDGNNGIGWLGR